MVFNWGAGLGVSDGVVGAIVKADTGVWDCVVSAVFG